MELTLRDAGPADAAACAAIYGRYVVETPATFEIDPPSAEEMARRIAECQAAHAFLVAEREGQVVGFAYGTRFAERPSYRWSCEVSIYLDPAGVGAGTGTALYEALLERLTARGFGVATAKVTQPNPASNALHAKLGFERVGLLPRIGFKLGAWHDIAILHRELAPPASNPAEPR